MSNLKLVGQLTLINQGNGGEFKVDENGVMRLGNRVCVTYVTIISSGGIIVDPSKVDAVLQWETLNSATEIRSFLGLVGYYRRFIEGFSKLVLLLTQLTRKGKAYV